MAIRLNASELGTLPGRGRKKQDARYAPEVAEAIALHAEDETGLLGVECTPDKSNAVRQGLYAAAKDAGVQLRTWALHEAERPRNIVAYRLKTTAELAAVKPAPELEPETVS